MKAEVDLGQRGEVASHFLANQSKNATEQIMRSGETSGRRGSPASSATQPTQCDRERALISLHTATRPHSPPLPVAPNDKALLKGIALNFRSEIRIRIRVVMWLFRVQLGRSVCFTVLALAGILSMSGKFTKASLDM